MSKQAVEQLLDAAAQDVALQQQLEAAGGFADAIKLGTDRGYNFTEDEAKEVLHERGISIENGADGELSERDLEAVAGGVISIGLRIRVW